MDILWVPILQLLGTLIRLYSWIILASIILNWLENFGMVNSNNRFVLNLKKIIYQMTEPVFKRIRPLLPRLENFDLTPLVLLLLLYFMENVISMLILKMIVTEPHLQRL